MRELTLVGGPHDGKVVKQTYDPTYVRRVVVAVIGGEQDGDYEYDTITGEYIGKV